MSPFAFMATYVHKVSRQAKPQHLPLGRALEDYAGARNRQKLLALLAPLSRAAEQSPLIGELVETGEYGVQLIDQPQAGCYDAIVLAVAHRQFRELGSKGIRAFGKPHCVLYDVKHILPARDVDGRL